MIRGTTPTHVFNLPIASEEIAELKIIYAQDDNILLTKRKNECEIKEKSAIIRLTQEETFLFDYKKPVQIEIRALLVNDVALKSPIMQRSVDKCLDNEVLE